MTICTGLLPREGLHLPFRVEYQRRYILYKHATVLRCRGCVALYVKLLLFVIQFAGVVETELNEALDLLQRRSG